MSIMKGYDGPEFPAHTTAIVESGVYADIESCDGIKLGSFQNKVTVLPGNHIVELMFHTQSMGDTVSYSREAAFVTFNAEAGHIYVAYADMIGNSGWVARIKEKLTDENIVQSGVLPIEIEHRSM
jgi:hypothetical protein